MSARTAGIVLALTACAVSAPAAHAASDPWVIGDEVLPPAPRPPHTPDWTSPRPGMPAHEMALQGNIVAARKSANLGLQGLLRGSDKSRRLPR